MRPRILSVSFAVMICLLFALPAAGQLRDRTSAKSAPPPISKEVRASAAFAEILLRKTELLSSVEELLVSYTEEFPKVKITRYELGLLDAELARFGRMKAADANKLTLALGKLIVRRAELATDYWILSNRYNNAHPDARKAKRKLEIFDEAVEEIL